MRMNTGTTRKNQRASHILIYLSGVAHSPGDSGDGDDKRVLKVLLFRGRAELAAA